MAPVADLQVYISIHLEISPGIKSVLQSSATLGRAYGKDTVVRPHIKLPGLKRHKKRADKQIVRIQKSLAESNFRKFRHESERFLRSHAARVVAADYVHRKSNESDRFAHVDEFQEAIERVDLFETIDEPVGLRLKRKGTEGDFRLIKVFGFRRKVAQRVIDNLLRAIGKTHEEQFSMRGGVNSAVSHAKELIEEKENAWIAHVDVQSAYSYVNKDVVEELIPLPRRVLNEYLFINDTCPLYSQSSYLAPPIGSDEAVDVESYFNFALSVLSFPGDVRSGLSQGAICSPVVFEMLIASSLNELNLTKFSAFADNILLVAASQKELFGKIKALRAKLKADPCGPFYIESLFVGEARQGFDFLGFHLEQKKGEINIRPSDKNLERLRIKFDRFLREYRTESPMERLLSVSRIEKKIRQWTATFSQSTDISIFVQPLKDKIGGLKKDLQAENSVALANNSLVDELETEAAQ